MAADFRVACLASWEISSADSARLQDPHLIMSPAKGRVWPESRAPISTRLSEARIGKSPKANAPRRAIDVTAKSRRWATGIGHRDVAPGR